MSYLVEARRRRHEERVEEYLLINGPYMSAAEAAARMGVTARTVVRIRAELRARLALQGTQHEGE